MGKVPNWTHEEMILACKLAYLREWRGVNTGTPGVKELSQLLRGMWRGKLGEIKERDRSVGSVSFKVNNLTAHVTPGKGLRKSKNEESIVLGFVEQPFQMFQEADQIERDFRAIAAGDHEDSR